MLTETTVLLVIRTYALYGRSRRIRWWLCAVSVIALVIGCVSAHYRTCILN